MPKKYSIAHQFQLGFNKLKFLILLPAFLFLTVGCQSTAHFITGNTTSTDSHYLTKNQHPIEVFKISNREAMGIIAEVSDNLFLNSRTRISPDNSSIILSYSNPWTEISYVRISPVLVRNLDVMADYGIIFKIAPYPSTMVAKRFSEGLRVLRDERSIKTVTFKKYELLRDKGLADTVAASIPTTYVGFKKFLNDKTYRKAFEGIWSTSDDKYTLGLIYVKDDPQFKYHAFIIDSKTPNWKPGEVKIKFRNLKNRKHSVSNYLMASKGSIGITWDVQRDLLVSVANSNVLPSMALIKNYPTEESDVPVASAGNAWIVTNDGVLITNAHVIALAKKIFVGLKGQRKYSARVLISDKRNNIALIKIVNNRTNMLRIPVKKEFIATNGTPVKIIAYQSFLPDSTPQIITGIIRSQSGPKNDITRFKLSANIKPKHSGGLVIDSNGDAVGMLIQNFQDESSTTAHQDYYAIKSTYIFSLLEQIGIAVPTVIDTEVLSSQDIFKKYKGSVLPIWTE